jgi:RNA polymerase primary sigma factor
LVPNFKTFYRSFTTYIQEEKEMADEKNILKPELLESSRVKGSVTAADIMESIEDTDVSIETLEKVYEALENNGSEIATDLDNSVFDLPEEELIDEELDDSPEDVDALLNQEGVSIDDPVRMYLKEIGKVPCCLRKESLSSQAGWLPATVKPKSSLSKQTCVLSSASQKDMLIEACSSST